MSLFSLRSPVGLKANLSKTPMKKKKKVLIYHNSCMSSNHFICHKAIYNYSTML